MFRADTCECAVLIWSRDGDWGSWRGPGGHSSRQLIEFLHLMVALVNILTGR